MSVELLAKSVAREKSYEFAIQVVGLCANLKEKKHFEIASQLLRSGTSIGANVEGALAGQSRKDFFAKMTIASKEARETNYWLRLIKDAGIIDGKSVNSLIEKSEELIKILTSIVKTGYTREETATKNLKLRTQN